MSYTEINDNFHLCCGKKIVIGGFMNLSTLVGTWTCTDGGEYEILKVSDSYIIYGLKKENGKIVYENIGILDNTDVDNVIISTWTDSDKSVKNTTARTHRIKTWILVKDSKTMVFKKEKIFKKNHSDRKVYFSSYGNLSKK